MNRFTVSLKSFKTTLLSSSSRPFIYIVFLFLASRIFILSFPPAHFSDVTAYYERYANIWRYGLTPYLEHLYEYPPATIPLVSLPLTLDQTGVGKYYFNYRFQIFLVDAAFFAFLLVSVKKISWLKKRAWQSLLAYVLLTTLVKNFFYEGVDLAFTAAIMSAFLSVIWYKPNKTFGQVITWALFWLSTSLKFLTLPLALPLGLIMPGSLRKKLLTCGLGFLLIWGWPLAKYRSSLQVSFVYNNQRAIKYASFPAHLIRWANVFTQTETQRQVEPDFEYEGPVSDVVTKANKIIFPLALLGVLFWSVYILNKKYITKKQKSLSVSNLLDLVFKPSKIKPEKQLAFLLKIFGVYIFTLFLTAKIFSQPFHIWYLPLVILFPFAKTKHWYLAIALATLMLVLDVTEFVRVGNEMLVGNLPNNLVRDVFRFLPMPIMLGLFGRRKMPA